MHDKADPQLLRAYAESRSEAAFAELVRRHTDLVYSAALRMVRDDHLARDVTQGAFIALAQNARQLADRPVLSGWLHRTAQNIAAQIVRTDVRRRVREQEAAVMNELLATASEVPWEAIAPHLDAALNELNDSDRDAVMLRYFEKKSAPEIAQILRIGDEAAQKRISRAVERLREYFTRQKVTVGAGGLAVLISTNAVQSAPAGLAITISAGAISGTTIATSAFITTKGIAMSTLQKIIASAAVAVLAGAGIYEARQAAQLRAQLLQQPPALLAGDIPALLRERDDATNRLAELLARRDPVESNSNQLELLQLRGELAALKSAADDPTEKTMRAVTTRIKSLKQILQQRPEKKIPELEFLTEKNWSDVAWNADLSTDDGIRLALSNLRGEAENTFLNEMMKAAMKKYLAANGDLLPANLLQLKPYFDVPVTDEMLQRYQLLQTGKPDKSADLVKLSVYNDEDYDSNHGMSINGAWGGGFNRVHDAIYDAIMAFTLAHNGQPPADISEAAPYLKRAVDPGALQKYFGSITADIVANPPSPEQLVLVPALNAYQAANPGQNPKKPSDLAPYVTTPDQQKALEKAEQEYPDGKP